MAVKPFSKEQLNFFKFSTLVLDEFPKVLRQSFITMWDSKVAVRPGFISWDDSITVRNMLLKSEGGKTDIPTTKSIDEWDCTALFKATIYAKTFGVPGSKGSTLNDLYLKKVKRPPGSFHSSVQSSTGNQDETYALAIDQLRLLRNTLCHSPKPEIVKTNFDNYVQLVTNALTAVNVDTVFVDTIGQMSEDDFPTEKVQELHECLLNELRAKSVFHDNMEQKLSSIDERTEKIENVEDIMQQKLSSIDERTEKMHTMMVNMSLGDKGNVPGNLTVNIHCVNSDLFSF
jgi:hypothetical protein